MNIVRELRKKKGIQQKELALSIGVSQPTVSEWESNKTDPSGERLKKLAEYFDVDELFILGYGTDNPSLYTPKSSKATEISETEQIVQQVLERLNPRPPETAALIQGIDRMSKDQRLKLLDVARVLFAECFTEETNNNES